MENYTLLFEDNYFHVNISQNEKYMLVTKATTVQLYDFLKKNKLCDISVKNVESSLFSQNEKWLVLRKASSMVIFDLNKMEIVKNIRTGGFASVPCKFRNDIFYYGYNHKDQAKSIQCINLNTMVKEETVKKSEALIRDFGIKNDELIVFYTHVSNNVIDIKKYNLASKHITQEKELNIKTKAIMPITFSDYYGKAFVVQDIFKDKSEILSVDLDTFEIQQEKSVLNQGLSVGIMTRGKYIYFNRQMTISRINLEDNTEDIIPGGFPLAIAVLCDNQDYFGVYNGFYISMYKSL